jgi:hypothetical protein
MTWDMEMRPVTILPVLLGDSLDQPIHDVAIHHSGGGVFAIRMGDCKLIYESSKAGYHEGPEPGSQGQLYNLAEDLQEQHNLYNEKPEIVDKMINKLKQVQEGNYR